VAAHDVEAVNTARCEACELYGAQGAQKRLVRVVPLPLVDAHGVDELLAQRAERAVRPLRQEHRVLGERAYDLALAAVPQAGDRA
jgi:hypothetical protein